jgi:hypothetical protein
MGKRVGVKRVGVSAYGLEGKGTFLATPATTRIIISNYYRLKVCLYHPLQIIRSICKGIYVYMYIYMYVYTYLYLKIY